MALLAEKRVGHAVLLGREEERARLGALLESARASRSGTLILRGDPGYGKTALLEDTREHAAGMHVLAARGVESESELPFAGLHQLIRPGLPLLDRLPGPQAMALRGALGLAERGGEDRFLISVACLTLLSELAEQRPVLCLVDDAQWLDSSSADALLFVARRLDAEGIAMVFAARRRERNRFEARDLEPLELGPLDGDAASALVGRRSGGPIAPAVRDVLLAQADGNPLAPSSSRRRCLPRSWPAATPCRPGSRSRATSSVSSSIACDSSPSRPSACSRSSPRTAAAGSRRSCRPRRRPASDPTPSAPPRPPAW